MNLLHAVGLPTYNLCNILWQVAGNGFLICIGGDILSMLQPIEYGMVVSAQRNFGIDPCPMECAFGCS